MKKYVLPVIALFLTASITVFAATINTIDFKDYKIFDSWYKNAVHQVNTKGIMNGYSDGYFRPENTPNRAELAVMFEKYDDYNESHVEDIVAQRLMGLMAAQEKFVNSTSPEWIKRLVILAEAGVKRSEKKSNYTLGIIENVPTGYSLYQLSGGDSLSYMVRYQGTRTLSGGDGEKVVDEWYGPFDAR